METPLNVNYDDHLRIESIDVTANFKYLWMKSVEGFDLTNHCAKSLLGSFDWRIHSGIIKAKDILLYKNLYYICGVTYPYVWKNNFHLAFERCVGEYIDCNKFGIHVVISNAREIHFSEDDVNKDLPQASRYEFRTCRNWQFANKMTYHNDTNSLKGGTRLKKSGVSLEDYL